MTTLDKEDIEAVAWQVRLGMLQLSEAFSNVLDSPRSFQVNLNMIDNGYGRNGLWMQIQTSQTSLILEFMAQGMVLDRFIFARPVRRDNEGETADCTG